MNKSQHHNLISFAAAVLSNIYHANIPKTKMSLELPDNTDS